MNQSFHNRDRLRANIVTNTVALEFGLQPEDLVAKTRRGTPHTALARQVAAYLFHTVFGINYTRIGRVFYRHPSTIRHACAVIEDYRSDSVLDNRLIRLERFLLMAPDLQPEDEV